MGVSFFLLSITDIFDCCDGVGDLTLLGEIFFWMVQVGFRARALLGMRLARKASGGLASRAVRRDSIPIGTLCLAGEWGVFGGW